MKISICTDGSRFQNSGPGAWADAIPYPDQEMQSICGFLASTTSNRAQPSAILEALRSLLGLREVIIYSDSQWCINVLNGVWRARWNHLITEMRRYERNHSVGNRCIAMSCNLVDSLAQQTVRLGRLELPTTR